MNPRHALPPLAVELLMRCYYAPVPNRAVTPAHATSRAMHEWVHDFGVCGIFHPDVTVENLMKEELALLEYLTPAGKDLVRRICSTPINATTTCPGYDK